MKLRPLQDRIIVERLEEESKTAGGILIPDTAKEKPQRGKIVAVGKGKLTEDGKVLPVDVKVGEGLAGSRSGLYQSVRRRRLRGIRPPHHGHGPFQTHPRAWRGVQEGAQDPCHCVVSA